MRTCFVVQGFGEKTDFATGRSLNLDASYEVIKEAVEEAGLRCVRADEIVHAGTIDQPMYESLLRADLVVADLSTSNVNAAFELGVRYALRPRATIIVAEEKFQNPFDVSHIVIRRYQHLGTDIGRREAARFRADLAAAIREIVNGNQIDSPVYTFLKGLNPPAEGPAPAAQPAAVGAAGSNGNAKQLLDLARAEMTRDNFRTAKALFETVHAMRPNDTYVVQQLALATYKSQEPSPREALEEARERLRSLDPDTTNDPETLGLWGAVHKRLCELTGDGTLLDVAIGSYERGFYLKRDYYTGINLAFLLNVRAARASGQNRTADAITDFVLARRVRRDVLQSCERALAAAQEPDQKFWLVATAWEASAGLEDAAAAERWKRAAEEAADAPWKMKTAREQVARLQQLLTNSPLAGL